MEYTPTPAQAGSPDGSGAFSWPWTIFKIAIVTFIILFAIRFFYEKKKLNDANTTPDLAETEGKDTKSKK